MWSQICILPRNDGFSIKAIVNSLLPADDPVHNLRQFPTNGILHFDRKQNLLIYRPDLIAHFDRNGLPIVLKGIVNADDPVRNGLEPAYMLIATAEVVGLISNIGHQQPEVFAETRLADHFEI